MGFSSNGVYSPASGAESATPGATIKSSIWNSVFTDYAAALTQLAQNSFTSSVTRVTATTYTVATSDAAIIFNQAAACVVTLPTVASNVGRWLRVKTVAGPVNSASANVLPTTSDSAPGSVVLASTAGKYAVLTCDGTYWVAMEGN